MDEYIIRLMDGLQIKLTEATADDVAGAVSIIRMKKVETITKNP
jgi:hypothetical protein